MLVVAMVGRWMMVRDMNGSEVSSRGRSHTDLESLNKTMKTLRALGVQNSKEADPKHESNGLPLRDPFDPRTNWSIH